MKWGWFTLWIVFWPATNYGQALLPLHASFDGITVGKPFLQQYQKSPAQINTLIFLADEPGRWKPVESINYGRWSAIGWAKFSVRSDQRRMLWLELTTHFMDSVGVWVGLPNGPIRRIRGPSSWREQATLLAPVNHHHFLYALNLSAHQTAIIWIRGCVIPGDAMKFGVRLWSPPRFLAIQQQELWGWAMFVGMVLSILGGVAIAFVFYRRTLYLLYGCYIGCLSVYALLNDGWGAFLPDSWAWFDGFGTIIHWLNVGLGAFVLFSRRFLMVPPSFNPFWVRWPEFIPMSLIAGLILFSDWPQVHHYQRINSILWLLGYIGFSGYVLIWLTYVANAFQRKFRLVWLLIIAVSVLLTYLFAGAFLVNSGLINSPLPDMVALRIALLIELIILSVGWLYRRKLLQTTHSQLELQNRALQADIIQTQETERQRIATDLHDDLGGTLATIRQRLDDIRQRTADPTIQQAFDNLEPLIQKSGHDLRRIAHNLMPPEFDRLGLRGAIEQLVQNIPAQPTRFEFVASGAEHIFPADMGLNIYRIVSELVQNIQKHAGAKRASVQLLYEEIMLSVLVEDDGVGIRAEKLINGAGIGLKSSKLRATHMGATLQSETGEGGTFVVLEVPYSPPLYAQPATPQNPAR